MWLIFMILIPIISFILGVLLNFEVRKIFARAQYRLGPLVTMYSDLSGLLGSTRILQPLYDMLKLSFKETLIPKSANKSLFIWSPWISLILALVSSYFISYGGLTLLGGIELSLIFLSYIIIGVTLFWIVGAAASSSPWSAIGVRREAELLFAIEVTLLSSIFSTSILANTLSIQGIIDAQLKLYPYLLLNPLAAIAFIVALLGKLHLKPFDIPDAEVEIVAGPFTEYSGKLLAVLLASKYFITATLIGLFVNIFLGGGQILPPTTPINLALNFVVFIFLCIIVTFIASLIHALAPRFRIDQGFKWIVTRIWPISIASLILSIILVSLGVV